MNPSNQADKFLKLANKLCKSVKMLHWHEPTVKHPHGYGYTAPSVPDPRFVEAVAQYATISASLPAHHPLCHAAMMIVLATAPPERQDEMLDIALDCDLIPKITAYHDEVPVYDMEIFGRAAGLTDEESEQVLDEIMEMRRAAGLSSCICPDDAQLQMVQ